MWYVLLIWVNFVWVSQVLEISILPNCSYDLLWRGSLLFCWLEIHILLVLVDQNYFSEAGHFSHSTLSCF